MITEIQKATSELIETLTKFQEKYECDHAELVQAVSYALDFIKNPPAPTGTLTPKGEADLKAEREKHVKAPAKTSPAAVLPNPPPAPKLNLVSTPTK